MITSLLEMLCGLLCGWRIASFPLFKTCYWSSFPSLGQADLPGIQSIQHTLHGDVVSLHDCFTSGLLLL